MTPQNPGDSRQPPPDPEPTNCTLEPIAEAGPDALPPDPAERIVDVKLCRIQFAWDNAFHHVTTHEADDIFQSAPSYPGVFLLIQAGAKLVGATFRFRFADTDEQNSADIRPPGRVKIKRPSTARRIASWLFKNRYLLSSAAALSELLTIFVLALAATAVPLTDDDPDDPGELDSQHRISCSLETR